MADETQQRFFTAAEPVFARFGYRKTSVEDICRVAGGSKRTFYAHFADKRDFFFALLSRIVDRMSDDWESGGRRDQEPVRRLRTFLDRYTQMVREHPILRLPGEEPELMRLMGEHLVTHRLGRADGPLERVLQEGVARGSFRKQDTRIATGLVLTLLESLYLLGPTLTGTAGILADPGLARETNRFVLQGLGADMAD
jgi:AcrR family transcriptional regulator